MDRKKKLRITQLILLISGISIIFFTYYSNRYSSNEEIISEENQKKIEKQRIAQASDGDVFYNIEYSGLDLAGNRYILRSEEAINTKDEQEKIKMKVVEAFFYFKDDTLLTVKSDQGIYNNKTLDMNFFGNVRANYAGSELHAGKAEYSNSKSFLIISEKVKIKDIRGTMVADRLLFDIKTQKLNIASNDDDKVNANINLK